MHNPFIRRVYWLLVLVVTVISSSILAAPIVVTDVAGRKVVLAQPATRVILADARALLALNIIHPETPLKGIIAWDNALKIKAPDLFDVYARKFPEIKNIPTFDNPYMSDFSVENALAQKPDLIVFDMGLLSKLQGSGVLTQLEKAAIPVLFIDFRQQPLTNTTASMTLLGQVFGEPQHAADFVQFYQQRLELIRQRVAALDPQQRPNVFIERHAGMRGDECCVTFGKGGFGQFIAEAGGNNMGSKLFPGLGGHINLEQLIASNPDYYLMTGTDWSRVHKGSVAVPLGYTADQELVQIKLQHLMNRSGINVLNAVKNKQVMALYHQFYDSPLNIIAVEAIAKFLHPALFHDLDPLADLRMIHQKYTALDDGGVFWAAAK